MSKPKSKLLNRVLAAVLAVVMVFSLMPYPTTVYAADENNQAVVQNTDDTQTGGDNTQIGGDDTQTGGDDTQTGGDDTQTDVVEQRKAIGFPADQTVFYTGEEQTVTLTVTELVAGDKLTYVVGEETNEVTIDADGAYAIPVTVQEIGETIVKIQVTTAENEAYDNGSGSVVYVQGVAFPENVTLGYDGEERNVNLTVKNLDAGDKLTYVVGEEEPVEKNIEARGAFDITVPVKNAGIYPVKISVVRNASYTAEQTVTVSVSEAVISGVDTVYYEDCVYNGDEQKLVELTDLQKGDEVVWNVNGVISDGEVVEVEGSYVSVYKAVNAGNYAIAYSVKRTNYKLFESETKTVTIDKQPLENVKLSGRTVTYNGKCIVLVNGTNEISEFGKLQYYVVPGANAAKPADGTPFGDDNTAVDAGTYTVFYKVVATDENYSDSAIDSETAIVNKAKIEFGAITAEVIEPEGRELTDGSLELQGDAVKLKITVEQVVAPAAVYTIGLKCNNDDAHFGDASLPRRVDDKLYHDFIVSIDKGGEYPFYPYLKEEDLKNVSVSGEVPTYVISAIQCGNDQEPLMKFNDAVPPYVIDIDNKFVSNQKAVKGDKYSEFTENVFRYKILEENHPGIYIDNITGEVTVDSYQELVAFLNDKGGSFDLTIECSMENGAFYKADPITYSLTVKYLEIDNPLSLIKYKYTDKDNNEVVDDYSAKWYTVPVKMMAINNHKITEIGVDDFTFESEIPFSGEKRGERRVYICDEEGHFAPIDPVLNIDMSAPTISEVALNGATWTKIVSFFSGSDEKELKVTVQVNDSNSGVKALAWTLDGENYTELLKENAIVTSDEENGIESWEFNISAENFPAEYKTTFKVKAKDIAGNTCDPIDTKGFIWDMISPTLSVAHRGNNGAVTNTVTAADGTITTYYNESAHFEVVIEDGLFDPEKITTDLNGSNISEEISEKWSNVGRVNSVDVAMKKDATNKLTVSGTDEAGNKLVGEGVENGSYTTAPIVIDTVAPKLTAIRYNGVSATAGVYAQEVIVEIDIEEQFFNSGAVGITYIRVLEDESTESGPIQEPKEYKNSARTGEIYNVEWTDDDDKHTAKFKITTDGDYQIFVKYTDYAGHELADVEFPVFTVDTTAPTMVVTYDNNEVENLKYYDAARTATVVIHEHNFSWDGVVFTGVDETKVTKTDNGDDHTATIVFDVEGDFVPTIDVEDLAGNSYLGEERFTDEFTLDWTIENPQIGGVANGKAYKTGVYPSITMQDINFDEDGYTLRLTRTVLGEHDVDVTAQFLGELETDPQGAEGSFGDFERVQENDGIYTLTATMKDLAGNESSSVVTFSVNRFGSVYKYDSTLVSLIKDGGAYVQAVEKDLVITEYNADRLLEDSLNLTITRDGRPVENVKFSATPTINEYAPLGQSGWYQYQYTISKENFAKDGLYKISVSSEDVAGNTPVNNSSEGMDIVFRVDATAAELTSIVGLEESIVNAAELNVRYNVFDAMGIRSIKVYVNGELVGSEINEFGGDKNNYSGSFTIAESNSKQSVRIVVEDLAGNITDTDASSFSSAYAFNNSVTVSTNIFVRLYANKPLFIGTCVGTAAVVAAVVGLISKRRKPEEETV